MFLIFYLTICDSLCLLSTVCLRMVGVYFCVCPVCVCVWMHVELCMYMMCVCMYNRYLYMFHSGRAAAEKYRRVPDSVFRAETLHATWQHHLWYQQVPDRSAVGKGAAASAGPSSRAAGRWRHQSLHLVYRGRLPDCLRTPLWWQRGWWLQKWWASLLPQ